MKKHETLLKKAEAGDVDAQYRVAKEFHYGTNEVKRDCSKAVFWYKKVVDTDSLNDDFGTAFNKMVCRGEAAFQLGEIFYWGEDNVEKDLPTAIHWYTEASKYVGQTEAFHILGNCYYFGEGVQQNYEKAVENYMKAGDDHAEAQWRLGLCYKEGTGVLLNEQKAFDCFLNASENADPSVMAQFELAQCFHYGIGTKQDIEKAKFWYRKAADEQHLYALEILNDFDED